MNRVGAFAFAVVLSALLAAPAARAQGETEIAAGAYFEKALENMTKKEGFHVRLGAEVSLGEGMAPMSITSEGWVRNPDLAFYKMTAMGGLETETYRKGNVSLRRDAAGEWQVEEGEGGLGDQRLANPMEYLNEFKKYSKDAVYLQNEKLNELECRVIKADPPAEAIRGFIGGIGIPEAAIDWKKAKLVFRVWISKDDSLVRQVIADLEVELAGFGGGLDDPAFEDDLGSETKSGDETKDGKKEGEPAKGGDDDLGFEGGDEFSQPMKLTPRARFEIFDYDKNVGLDRIPEVVKKKLKIQ